MPADTQLNRPAPCKAWGVTRLDDVPIPDAVTCSYLNAGGLKSTPVKRAALGRILRGELHFSAADIACHAEVHADEDSEKRDWAHELNPSGRSYFTHHLSVHLSHRLQGVPVQASSYSEGRVIRLDLLLPSPTTFVFLYAPGDNVGNRRQHFFNSIRNMFPAHRSITCCGDFNYIDNIKLDKRGGSMRSGTAGSREWNVIRATTGMYDVWRRTNPASTTTSWIRKGQTVSTRIDRLEQTADMAAQTDRIDYHTVPLPGVDHKMLRWRTLLTDDKPPPPPRRMIPQIMHLGDFPQQMRDLVHAATLRADVDGADLNVVVDSLTDQAWEAYETHAALMRQQRHRQIKKIQRSVDKADALHLLRELNDGKAGRLHSLAAATERAAAEATNEHDLAELEFGDKPTRRFFQQVKAHRSRTVIRKLYRYDTDSHAEDPTTVDDDPQQIADSLASFYQDLFSEREMDEEVTRELVDSYTPVSADVQHQLGAPFVLSEVRRAIDLSACNKSAGSTGLPSEFYKMVAEEIAPLLTRQFNYARKHGKMSDYQNHGLVTLVHKKGPKASASNYRPLTILNRDYTLASTVCVLRTRTLMQEVCNPQQTGFCPGRDIQTNVMTLHNATAYAAETDFTGRDELASELESLGTTALRRRAAAVPDTVQQLQEAESSRCPRTAYQKIILEAREQQRCPCILSTDFAKAFDMLQHDYIFRVHERLFGTPGSAELKEDLSTLSVAATRRRASAAGASPTQLREAAVAKYPKEAYAALTINMHNRTHSFGGWIRMLYGNSTRQLAVNGVLSKPFIVKGGAPQGDPYAAPAFSICAESLASRLREVLRGQGLPHPDGDTETLLVSFADDMALVLLGTAAVLLAIDTIEKWCTGCGMQLNRTKTVGLYIGEATDRLRPDYAVYVDETPDPARPPPRMRWERPGGTLTCVGSVVGPTTLADTVWADMHERMFHRIIRWSRVHLGYRARTMVIKTLVTSIAWYQATVWPMPKLVSQRLTAMTRCYFWTGTLPATVTARSPASAFRCRTPLRSTDIAQSEVTGGWGLWSAADQSKALLARWVARLIAPGHEAWKTLPRYWLRRALGVQSMASEAVLLLRDKPLKDSALVKTRVTRVVDEVPTCEFLSPPPRWRAYFAAWDDVTNNCTVAPPTTNEEMCAQPIFHNRHLPGLAPSWRPHGDTQPGKWIIAGVHRLDEVWNGDKNYWFKLSQIKSRAAANADTYEPAVRSRVRQCAAALDEDTYEAIKRAVINAGWWITLIGTIAPLEVGEWAAPLTTAITAHEEAVPAYCVRIDSHHDGVYDTTIGHIAEETGRVTVQPQLTERHSEMQLYRIAAVYSPTLPYESGRPQPSHVLGFQDVHGPTLLTTMTGTTSTATGSTDATPLRQYTTTWGRQQLAPPTDTVIQPIADVAERRGVPLTPRTLRPVIATARTLRWPRQVHEFWWKLVTGAWLEGLQRAMLTRLSHRRYCQWCLHYDAYAADNTDHALDECPGWAQLRKWSTRQLKRVGTTLDSTADHPAAWGNYMLYGWSAAGLTNPRPEATAAIRAATLRTINALNTALQIDNQWWPPEQAPRRAAGYLRRMIQLDYYDINRTPANAVQGKLRQAPASVRQAPASTGQAPTNAGPEPASPGQTSASRQPKVAAFARRWAGLVLTRRNDYVLKFD